jgi:hypothetical protein
MELKSPDLFTSKIENLFEELIKQQQAKVLSLARERIKHLTGDDINNPHDYPVLREDPE